MRPSDRPKGDHQLCLVTQAPRHSIRSAHYEDRCWSVGSSPILQMSRKCRAVHVGTVFVQKNRDGMLRNHVGDGDRFFERAAFDILGPALLDLKHIEGGQPNLAAEVGSSL